MRIGSDELSRFLGVQELELSVQFGQCRRSENGSGELRVLADAREGETGS